MRRFSRWMIWAAVVLLPGGVLLLPLALGLSARARREELTADGPIDPAGVA